MAEPKRIQRRRTRGWRIGDAVYVGRPTRWGNYLLPTMLDLNDRPLGIERAVELYRLSTLRFLDEGEPVDVERWIAPLRGRDLACWCDPTAVCHADVLLELANA